MSNMARSDEIDELVSSVRNLVAYKDGAATRKITPQDRLILTPALRIDDPAVDTEVSENKPQSDQDEVLVLHNAVPTDKASLGDRVAELEVAVTARAEDWEPDGGETFDQAAWAASAFEPPQDDSATLVTPLSDDVPVADIPQPEPEELDPSDADVSDLETRIASDIVEQHFASQIDEGALRAAVVRILREELAGDMGERITRNVRKLVRREINRVLVSRDLD
ncbi:hypothetical protein [Yoonia vestfoldensis]|uniref:hypothetical protein n=1 Tax=Yoonia vestfoldensis TaxID=245188 RepID=UPI00035ED4BB|nr:hypothetical protein [Yoonia vestfoldensis]